MNAISSTFDENDDSGNDKLNGRINPHGAVSLGDIGIDDNNDGPRLRLIHSPHHHELWVLCDEALSAKINCLLKDAGFVQRYSNDAITKVEHWIKQIDPSYTTTAIIYGKHFIKNLATQCREEKGLSPIALSGSLSK